MRAAVRIRVGLLGSEGRRAAGDEYLSVVSSCRRLFSGEESSAQKAEVAAAEASAAAPET
jgi:hypothetical protein